MTNPADNTEPKKAFPGARKTSEEALAKIWTEVLRRPCQELDANFFDIGGDSMKAMEVIVRVSETLQVTLPLISFFEDPTIAHLAAVVDELKGDSAPPAIVRVPGRREFPLSYSQQVFWLLQQQHSGTGVYNTARTFRIRGNVDAALMERSLNELHRRHEILQVRFALGTDGPVQVVAEPAPLQLAVADVSTLAAEAREQAALKLANETVTAPFDLNQGPALRAKLIRLSTAESLLCMAIHHVISDGFTGSILLDELGTIYDAFAAGQPNPLPALDLHFTDYAAWERQWMQDALLDQQLDHWRSVLKNVPSLLDLPTDLPRTDASNRRASQRVLTIPGDSLQQLQGLAQSNGTTLFTALATALRILLYRWSAQSDFLFGTIASNRSRTGTERMVGCFVNPLALRNQIRQGQSALALLNSEKDAVMDAFAHQDCPFAKIVEAINPERGSTDNPLFNVVLLLQNFPAIAYSGQHFKAEHFDLGPQAALLDLRFIATEISGSLQLVCEYNTDLFESKTVDQLLNSYQSVLKQIVATPDTSVDQISISEDLLQRGAKHRQAQHKQTIAISANFTAEPIEEALQFWMQELSIPSQFAFAPYNQIFQELLNPASQLRTNQSGINILLIRLEDWRKTDTVNTPEQHSQLTATVDEFIAALKAASASSSSQYVLCFCPPSKQAASQIELSSLLQRLEAHVAGQLNNTAGVNVVTTSQLMELYPVADYADEYAERVGHIPYTNTFFSALGTILARRIYRLRSAPHKVIVLDCDNTLWKGICGEDGPTGVIVDPPRKALQDFMVNQMNAGMLLCICSKNNEADVWKTFETNPGMILRREQIVASRINWQAKSENLHSLAAELKLGLDSFIFIDDSAMECSEVETRVPEVLALQLPEDVEEIPQFLNHIWAFDNLGATEEDKRRGEMYRDNSQRELARQEAPSLDDFLASLNLEIEIAPMTGAELPRVAQLTERTNQFNCTTIRRSETEIAQLTRSQELDCITVKLRDRFGDYGLIGAVLFSSKKDNLYIDTMLLSCRALGRRVEHAVLAHLANIARERGLSFVAIPFIPTAKNNPALQFLESIGNGYRQQSPNEAQSIFLFPVDVAADAVEHAKSQPELAMSAPGGSQL